MSANTTSSGAPGTSSSSTSSTISTSSSSSSSSISTSPSSTSTSTSTTSKPTSTSTSVSTAPPTTHVTTKVVTDTPSGQTSAHTTTVTSTSVGPGKTYTHTVTSPVSSTGNQTPSQLANGSNNGSGGSKGLSTGGTTAIAVVIPVVVVALLVGFGIWFWRRRKQKNLAAEERRKEVEDYGFNPNQDPRLPVVAADGPQMAEDQSSGYRGWGTMSTSNRKASTTMSGGHGQQLSDAGNSEAMMGQRDTLGSDDLGALGAAPVSHSHNNAPIKRGVSNASSAYSAGGRSDHSDDAPPVPSGIGQAYEYTPTQGYGYSQHGPYGDGTYGGGQTAGMPVVQDVSARRNTRIQPGGSYQQGNSGIAQNF